jgi:tRNA1(Val) A37 N6-methylase TrmN6
VNYDKEFLLRITNEIVKIYGYLAVVYPDFRAEDLFKGCNSDSLNIRRSCHSLIYIYFLQNPNKKFALLEQLIYSSPVDMKPVSNTFFDLVSILIEKTIEL